MSKDFTPAESRRGFAQLMETCQDASDHLHFSHSPDYHISVMQRKVELPLTGRDADALYRRCAMRFREWTGQDIRFYTPGTPASRIDDAEFIVRAAVEYQGAVYSVAAPGRHHHVGRIMSDLGLGPETMHGQGFVTNSGRFVNRKEAFVIAKAAGQIGKKSGNPNSEELYSEDLW